MKLAKVLVILPIALIVLFVAGKAKAADDSVPHYRIQVHIEPSSHKLEADVWIQSPPSSQFKLNKDFAIQEITADAKRVEFHRDPSSISDVIVDAAVPRELHVRYEGEIRNVIEGVNLIGPDLVELALYSAWYPRFVIRKDFTFEIEANLPKSFLTITNGRQTKKREENESLITNWTSYRPGFDVTLVASPLLRQATVTTRGNTVEMYYSHLSPEVVESAISNLRWATQRLSKIYGPPNVKGVIRFAYVPRGGWGYSRIPLFVVSEKYAQQQLSKENGQAEDFIGTSHEMAHFWWNIAEMSTPDDWINEALAEYSAFRLTDERFGKGFSEKRVAEYQQHAARAETITPIAETESSSPDRYVNRYEKTTLMFLQAQRRFGQKSLDRCLSVFYRQFAGTHKATTGLFLKQVRESMGTNAEAFFRAELFRKGAAAKASSGN